MTTLAPHAHKLVMSVAVNAAAGLYETLMGDNMMYSAWKAKHPGKPERFLRRQFVLDNAARCIPIARATLAGLLRDPTISEDYKETIVEALALDRTLMKGRASPAQVIGTTTEESKA